MRLMMPSPDTAGKVKRTLKIVFSVLVTAAAVCGAGYMLFLFHTTSYLPLWLCIVMRFLCVLFGVGSVLFLKKYISALD